MRKKLQQFRRKIRQDDINSYKENVRDILIEAVAHDEKIEEFNKELNFSIEVQDPERFYEKLINTDKGFLKAIDKSIVFKSYEFFTDQMEKVRSSHILRQIVQAHTSLLFRESSLQSKHEYVFGELHRLADELIGKLRDTGSIVSQQHLESYLALLACFYGPKHHKELKNLIADQGMKQVLRYVLPWAKQLSKNLPYLRLLANVLNHFQLAVLWSRKIDEDLILQVSRNLEVMDEKKIYWSLVVLNSAIRNWDTLSEKCLKQLLPNYLSVVSQIFPHFQAQYRSRNTDFKKQNMQDCLYTLEKLVRVIWESKYRRVQLGRLMEKHKTYTLFSLINQIQYFPDRCLLYGLLQFSICVAMDLEEDDHILQLISCDLQSTLLLGLGNKFSSHITLNALHSIDRLVRYQSQSYNPKIIIFGLRNLGIVAILEYLQYNKHQQIASIAFSLLQGPFSERAMETFV